MRSARIDALRHVMAGLWHNARAVCVRGVFSAGTRRPTRTANAVDVKLRRFAKWPSRGPSSFPPKASLSAAHSRCGLCSARANRACWTPVVSGCGCAAVGPEPGTDVACTCLAPLMTACAFGSFRKPCPHYTAHRCGRQTRIHARRPAMGSGAQPQLQIQIHPDDKGHRLSAESRGAPGEAVAEPSLKAVGV